MFQSQKRIYYCHFSNCYSHHRGCNNSHYCCNKKKKKDPTYPPKVPDTENPILPDILPTEKPTDNPNPPTEKPNPPPTEHPTEKPNPPPTNQPTEIQSTYVNTNPPLKKEFSFNTNTGDLKRISVIQTSMDQSLFNNQLISTDVTRQTVYDIIFLSAEKAPEEKKHLYSTMYTGAISIASECYKTGEEKCEPKEMVDLTKIKEDETKKRILEDNINFENASLATCLFNITDNDFITSITCHKKYPDIKKNEMLLDLYFFRAPAIERKNKTKDNITITFSEDKNKNRKYIRETNGGLCKIHNNWGSLCTTDMNMTTDLEDNLISYDELAVTNIIYDGNNSFTKTKKSNLVDHSANITKEDAENYKKNYQKLLEKMKPHMKVDIQFSEEKFDELYDLIKTNPSNEENEKETNTRRRLSSHDLVQYIKQKDLFHMDSLGVEININMKLNPGLNTDKMSSNLELSFDDETHELYNQPHLSNIQNIIDQLKALSKAGNILATELYDKIINKLEDLPNEMSIKLKSLYDLFHYYDLFEVFNSTLMTISHNKISPVIIQLSNELVSQMSGLYYDIEIKGKAHDNVQELVDTVYDFVNKSHDLVDIIYKNIHELSNTLRTKNNPFTKITNYYMSNTFASYINMVKKSRHVFETYFSKEVKLTYPKIEKLIQMFEKESNETLESEREYILDLYIRLLNGSLQIVDIPDDNFQKVLSNLLNTYNFTYDIITKISEYIIKGLDIKDSGYYISNADIDEKNKTYGKLYTDSKEVEKILNDDSLIDKVFDEIMIKFKESFLNLTKYMAEKKSEYFTLDDDVLKESLFTEKAKNNIDSKINEFTKDILSKFEREIIYKQKAEKVIEEFLSANLTILNEIIADLEIIISEENLKNLTDAFEIALNQSLNKLCSDIDNNSNLTKEYFEHFYLTITDNNYLINNLSDYHIEEIPKIKSFFGYGKDFKNFTDEISQKERTTAYLSKYTNITSIWNYTEKYLKNQLSVEVLEDYKKIFNNIKEVLQSVLYTETLENYVDLNDLTYYNSHFKRIKTLQDRIDKYFSEEIFKSKYSKYIDNIKTKYNTIVNEEKNFIKEKHDYIMKLPENDSKVYDFCIVYERKICYGCTNCVWNTFDYGRFCIVLTPYENNYLKFITSDYDNVENNLSFKNALNGFMGKMNEKINEYTSIMKVLEDKLIKVKEETFDKDLDSLRECLNKYKDWIKNILNEKFGNKIIQASYNYYSKQVTEKGTILLNEIETKIKKAFNILYNQLNNNVENIKYTMYEFNMMAEIYQDILKENITWDYFESIVLFQKSEFNYTITQYYNYLYDLINNSYTYVLANFPKKEDDFNYFLMKIKNETINYYELILSDTVNSEKLAMDFEHQKSILDVKEYDFFKINSSILNKIEVINTYINDKINDILDIEIFNDKLDITQYSLTTRFYLENREFGKLLEALYEPLEQGTFFYLNLDKFKDMMVDHWIFDVNDFSNILNDALYDSNKEIKNEINIILEDYEEKIEQDIIGHFTSDIDNTISNLFEINIKQLTNEQKTNIKNLIDNNNKKIQEKIIDEIKNITSYQNYYSVSKIENTLEFYKNYLMKNINNSLSFILDEFHQNIIKSVYTNCIENKLNMYLDIIELITRSEECSPFEMLNYTYNIGEIINNLASKIVSKIKIKAKKQIFYRYQQYYEKIMSDIDFISIQSEINDALDEIYETEILEKINEHNKKLYLTNNVSYDFSNILKVQINKTIDETLTDIESIITTTKGSNFNVQFECSLSFSYSKPNIYSQMCESFKETLITENEEQITKIGEIIQDTIKTNLNGYLQNAIPLFGNDFFDRIIDYNINFQILNLYDNLKYALAQNFLYYAALGRYTDTVTDMPVDLKFRLYRLNDLNYTIKEKRTEIINLLEDKLNELINNLTNIASDTYTYYLKENTIIKNNFNSIILTAIENNLNVILPQIEKEYNEALQKYLKNRFVDSFTNILDEETNNLLDDFDYEQKRLKEELDKLFSEKIDDDLHEVNKNIHSTITSIWDYYIFIRTFSIPDKLSNFFALYANITLVPLFETFRYDLENLTYISIVETINNKSKLIEKINVTEFLSLCRELKKYFEINYYNPILAAFYEYNTPSYHEKLINKTKDLLGHKTLRRLLESDDETDTKRLETKNVEESFTEIYELIKQINNSFFTCLECDYLYQMASNYVLKTSKTNKYIKWWITKNEYSKNVFRFLMNKLNYLNSILSDYYSYSKIGVEELYNHMNNSILSIEIIGSNSMHNTANILNKEYQTILNTTKDFNKVYKNEADKSEESYEYIHKTEHMINTAKASFDTIKEYSEFQYESFLKGDLFKTSYVKAKIVSTTRPNKMALNVRAEYGFCGRTTINYNVKFSDANYTMTIDYNTKTNNIHIDTYTDFDKYNYSTQMYQIPEKYDMDNITYFGNTIYFMKQCYNKSTVKLSDVYYNEIDAKNNVETMVIVG